MSQEKKSIAGLMLKTEKPTKFKLEALHRWTIWQFPRKIKDGLCGAVHPPITAYGWLPAIIKIKDKSKKAYIYGHLNQTFDTPEAAADYLEKEAAKK